jgi:salicylate hydroxylase
MVVEDAAVLGDLFSRLRSWDQVPSLMEAYQDLRKNRTEFVAVQCTTNAEITWMGPGPEREARNKVMGENMNRGLDDWDESMIQDQWNEISDVFSYDAIEAAADWWAGWGMLGEMAKKRARTQMEISVRVVPSAYYGGPDSKVLTANRV